MSLDNSAARKIDVFFYGLYMDPDVLSAKDVSPSNPRRAEVEHFTTRIGEKATLLRAPGGRSLGMLYAISHAELEALYNGMSVYVPEPVLARTEGGITVPALTMVLIDPPTPSESNPDYEAKLRIALAKVGLSPSGS